jgi:hypothetical protein
MYGGMIYVLVQWYIVVLCQTIVWTILTPYFHSCTNVFFHCYFSVNIIGMFFFGYCRGKIQGKQCTVSDEPLTGWAISCVGFHIPCLYVSACIHHSTDDELMAPSGWGGGGGGAVALLAWCLLVGLSLLDWFLLALCALSIV